MLVTDGAGTVSSGSAATLSDAVQAGADVRVGLSATGAGTWTGTCRALRFDASSDRVACVSWDVELAQDGATTAAYRFIVINSDGAVRNHRIGFGTTTSLGTDAPTPTAVQWFIRR